jgi:hypothetical protein
MIVWTMGTGHQDTNADAKSNHEQTLPLGGEKLPSPAYLGDSAR